MSGVVRTDLSLLCVIITMYEQPVLFSGRQSPPALGGKCYVCGINRLKCRLSGDAPQ